MKSLSTNEPIHVINVYTEQNAEFQKILPHRKKIFSQTNELLPRPDKRNFDELRPIKIQKYFQRYPAGSVLIEQGNTKIICAASFEEHVPNYLRGTGQGWLRAEYSLLPSSTFVRTARETMRYISGRTQEIQRLISRSLRSVIDFYALGERTVVLDCDVIQADGGTRTAAITGSFIALVLALNEIIPEDKTFPVKDFLAAVSVGMRKDNQPILDLCYEEDSEALVDMNFVMTDNRALVEVQGTGEGRPFSREEFQKMYDLAEKGIAELISYQKNILGNRLDWRIGCVR